MAGDWIKMRHDLTDDPTVFRLAKAFNIDRYGVIGRLHAFWSWADRHAVDGRVDGASSTDVDDVVRLPGFAAALVGVGWLTAYDNGGIEIPNHERHSGESAKERGLKNQRQARWRAKKAAEQAGSGAPINTPAVGASVAADVDASPSTGASTREEKRRGEEKEKDQETGALRAAASRGSKRCPEDFVIPDETFQMISGECPGIDVAFETAKFRDWEFARLRTDWLATWRTWMRKAFEAKVLRDSERPTGETGYAKTMREKYEAVTPMVAAKKPGQLRPNPMDVIEGMVNEHARIAG